MKPKTVIFHKKFQFVRTKEGKQKIANKNIKRWCVR